MILTVAILAIAAYFFALAGGALLLDWLAGRVGRKR